MARRSLLLALITAGALLIPTTAGAKGPVEATITGPGLDSPLTFSGGGEGGNTVLGMLVMQGGFFAQVFGQTPSPTMTRPRGALGPQYTVTYVVPGPSSKADKLRQHLYPYAKGGPVTYARPGQRFWDEQTTHGGWVRGTAELKSRLIAAGLPKKAPAAQRSASPGRAIAIGTGAGILLAGAALLLLRRRH